MTRPPLRLVICGSVHRSDDGAPEATLPFLPPALRQTVDLRRREGLDPVDLLEPAVHLLVVDAVVGPRPGTIVVRPLAELSASDLGFQPVSSHLLPIPTLVELARRLRGVPPAGTFIGIAGARFHPGTSLSPAVRRALPRLARRIAAEVEAAGSSVRPSPGGSARPLPGGGGGR